MILRPGSRSCRSMMTMEQVLIDVGPELSKYIGKRVAADGVGIFLCEAPGSLRLAGIVGQRDGLRDAAAQDLRSVEAVFAVIVGRDEHARGRVDCRASRMPPSPIA